MSGTVNIARSIFDHAVFADEPKTEREAWIWLIMEASWKPRTRRVGAVVVETQRGQLAASVRFLASAWKWTAPKVQRYLKRLEKMEMIRAQADTGVTVITICNYDQYQAGSQASDTPPIQQRYSADTNEKKEVIREEGKEDADASLAVREPSSPTFDQFWAEWPLSKVKKDAARKAFSGLSAKQRIAATGSARQWALNWKRDHPSLSDIHPSSYLNGKRWEDELPAQPTFTVIPGGPREQSPRRSDRQAAASDALRYQLDVVGRTRPSPQTGIF